MKKILFILLFVLTGIMIPFAQNPVSINTSNFTYSQNFNTLTTAGNWTNGSTLTGWYAKSGVSVPPAFYLNDGSLTTTSPPLVSFGTVSDSDRALGFVPVGSNNDLQSIGLRMENNSGSTLTSFTISWDGEQWRNGSILSQYIKLYYKTSTSDITVLPISTTGLTAVNQFDSPENLSDGQSAVALNGNDAANRGTLTATISVSLANGSEIMFIWFDTRNAFSFDHLFAIDNVTVTSSTQQPQTITFPEFEDIEYDNVSFSPGATASSGLPVTYSSSNTSVASISGSNLVINGVGSTVITANQAGGSGYLPATSVQRTLNVYPQIPVMGAATSVTANSFVATWTIDNGATDANVNYLLYVDDNASFSSPVTYSSSGKSHNVTGLSPGVAYNFRVVAKSGSLYSEDYSNSQSVLIGNDVVISSPGNWSELIGNNTIANKITIAA
ncbi:MAG: fibronectin type III domain-containing protein, partial [Paludibacter sp.]|nr:fibronectin type III domain-containing protein [Paludibacter sp.]